MKLVDLLSIMNIGDVELFSTEFPELYGRYKINMIDWKNDPMIVKFGSCEVKELTNICKLGDMIKI